MLWGHLERRYLNTKQIDHITEPSCYEHDCIRHNKKISQDDSANMNNNRILKAKKNKIMVDYERTKRQCNISHGSTKRTKREKNKRDI